MSLANANLTILPTYLSGITSRPDAAQIEATIQQAINVYQAKIADNVTVKMSFNDMSSGGGFSGNTYILVSYRDLRSHLASHATSADDATALANLPNQDADPLTNTTNGVYVSTSLARALGFNAPSAMDVEIGLHLDIMNRQHGVYTDPVNQRIDLMSVTEHEIDEGLNIGGGGTGPDIATLPPDPNFPPVFGISVLDLFRFGDDGTRFEDQDPTKHAYFSLDGHHMIDEFNQFGYRGGDYGDWIRHATPEVQDWAGTRYSSPDLGLTEIRSLDAVGWTLAKQAVPEPTSLGLIGAGLIAVYKRRNRK